MPLHHVLMPQAIFVADAYRDDEKRFVVRADEKLTALMELPGSVSGDAPIQRAISPRRMRAAKPELRC